MIQALFYKEWVKLKWTVLFGFAFGLCSVLYIWSELAFVFRESGAVAIWDAVLHQGFMYYVSFRYFPLLMGLALALFQMIPEVQHKRIKLVMHLPAHHLRVLFSHTLIGTMLLLGVFFVVSALLLGISAIYFPYEIVVSVLQTIIPWLLAGWSIYLIVSFAVVEPKWNRRIAYVLIGLASVYLNYLYTRTGMYLHSLPLLLAVTLAYLPAMLFTGSRFKKGVQG
ncbi:MAG: hypothetical protein MI784_17985 [Cytophagales bacterium]|nr:hypothetical protein [Cytophagales bacterium]